MNMTVRTGGLISEHQIIISYNKFYVVLVGIITMAASVLKPTPQSDP